MYLIRAGWEKEGACAVHVPKHGFNNHYGLSHTTVLSVHGGYFFLKGVRSVPDKFA